ncbi:helix-turn-helix domain-containing protein [Streptomyces sp. NBC_01261]|uniref:helix-turn-helix domain-containing protein n=1 Tax=unclassified Streptomyces TaxID=2593676 RepID=UPI002E382487|nr:helix-turn-helix domain-containing protein [Streptomyces sp. NBC_01261]
MARGLATVFDGRRLRQARETANGTGLSVAALATAVGASKEEIVLYETRQRRPEAPRIRRLAEALNVAPISFADAGTRNQWTLADLRRVNGYRLQDFRHRLRLSVRAYGRLEREGLSPAGQFSLLADLAEELGVDVTEIEKIISRSPRTQERLRNAAQPLNSLIDRHTDARRLDQPHPKDPQVVTLASLFGRSPATVASLVSEEISALRILRRRKAALQAAADFAATTAEQAEALQGLESQEAAIDKAISTLPRRLDTFFRCTLPAEHSVALAHLAAVAGTLGVPLTATQLTTPAETLNTIPAHLIEIFAREATDGEEKYAISEDGIRHQEQYQSWYDALYPHTRPYLRIRGVPANGHLPLAEVRRRFSEVDTILLSFDGLLCRLWPTNRHVVSHELKNVAHDLNVPLDSQAQSDPVAMLRSIVRNGSSAKLRRFDSLLTSMEVTAATQASPLPGVSQFLHVMNEERWNAAVVTDHATDAVETFLSRLGPGLAPGRLRVFGRSQDPRVLKPHPHVVTLATSQLKGVRSRTVLLGESVADFLAARSAGVSFIGVASSPRQLRMLRQAGVTATVGSVQSLTRALGKL